MEGTRKFPGQLVFGLDIGTRSIVGTVGYRRDDGHFVVVAQCGKEHETRAMLDGQIHDIAKVGNTIREVKERLEFKLTKRLEKVCIAAAGRVLKTIQTHTDMEFGTDKIISEEDIYALNSKAIEEAYKHFIKENESDMKFYCVGSSVVRYYMNDYSITNLESHKAKKIGVDMIATFLPDDVVDGLYKAVESAGLSVASLTLEPIAAIELAIPEKFRLLNIALVDVGAGTSDISITKEGTITAFGMIPVAGDSLTETIAQHCMVEFNVAEKIKREAGEKDVVTYEDILGLPQQISASEVEELLYPSVKKMTDDVAEKILELNGGKSVGAVFVVGGGGKIPGYTKALAERLGIAPERVAIRGKEVMQTIVFEDTEMEQNSLLVTPIGICLDFYKENHNFIFVSFNDTSVKLYNNDKLTIMDVAVQADYPSADLFPKSGKQLTFTVNGKTRFVRGEMGEGAVIALNGEPANLYTQVKENDIVRVLESTAGAPGKMKLEKLPEFKSTFNVFVNGQKVTLPKFPSVNGNIITTSYEIQEGDNIEFLDYMTVDHIRTTMDIIVAEDVVCMVNNKEADKDTKVYENFEVVFKILEKPAEETVTYEDLLEESGSEEAAKVTEDAKPEAAKKDEKAEEGSLEETPSVPTGPITIYVSVNGNPVKMSGKPKYVFVDVFNYINFDLSKPQGVIVTTINGHDANYMEELHDKDIIEIYWRKF